MTDGVHSLAGLGRLGVDVEAVPGAASFALTRPDEVLALVCDGQWRASAALWWREPLRSPAGEDGHVGRIGHAAWSSVTDGAAVVDAALERLRGEGVARVLGPIDGSTWFSYRVVTDPAPDGGAPAPPFALEPWPSPEVAAAFEERGFAPVAHYLSSRIDRLPDESARLSAEVEGLAAGGVTVRAFRLDAAEAELRGLHPLLLAAFADNPFFAPLDLDRFLQLYRPLLAHLDPDLVRLAEAGGRPVGVVLAIEDLAQRARGEPVDTVVVKTLAVHPGWRGRGLGGTLVRGVQEAARARGLTSAIHALMHADNASVRIGRHLGRPIRRYALLGRDL